MRTHLWALWLQLTVKVVARARLIQDTCHRVELAGPMEFSIYKVGDLTELTAWPSFAPRTHAHSVDDIAVGLRLAILVVVGEVSIATVTGVDGLDL